MERCQKRRCFPPEHTASGNLLGLARLSQRWHPRSHHCWSQSAACSPACFLTINLVLHCWCRRPPGRAPTAVVGCVTRPHGSPSSALTSSPRLSLVGCLGTAPSALPQHRCVSVHKNDAGRQRLFIGMAYRHTAGLPAGVPTFHCVQTNGRACGLNLALDPAYGMRTHTASGGQGIFQERLLHRSALLPPSHGHKPRECAACVRLAGWLAAW